MELEFTKYERAKGTLTSLGKVMKYVTKDGKIFFSPKNLKDKTKRVVAILERKDGTSLQITCSEQVSNDLRKGTIKASNLLNYEILHGEAGIPFISSPGGLVTFAVKDIAAVEVTTLEVTEDELTALMQL